MPNTDPSIRIITAMGWDTENNGNLCRAKNGDTVTEWRDTWAGVLADVRAKVAATAQRNIWGQMVGLL